MLICLSAAAQIKPHIDFDRLLKQFPTLPWNFEVRYVVHDGLKTDLLRIHYDRRVDLVKWRPEDTGSLSEVCHAELGEKQFRHLLELFRDKNFNDLHSDDAPLRTVAQETDATVSVLLGRTAVRKTDRHERDNAGLAAIETELDSIQKLVSADPKTKCGLETVPAKP